MAIGVIGLGYVGLPLAVAFAEGGGHVVAVDVDEAKIAAIEAGVSYIEDVPNERLEASMHAIEWSNEASWSYWSRRPSPEQRVSSSYHCSSIED